MYSWCAAPTHVSAIIGVQLSSHAPQCICTTKQPHSTSVRELPSPLSQPPIPPPQKEPLLSACFITITALLPMNGHCYIRLMPDVFLCLHPLKTEQSNQPRGPSGSLRLPLSSAQPAYDASYSESISIFYFSFAHDNKNTKIQSLYCLKRSLASSCYVSFVWQ